MLVCYDKIINFVMKFPYSFTLSRNGEVKYMFIDEKKSVGRGLFSCADVMSVCIGFVSVFGG